MKGVAACVLSMVRRRWRAWIALGVLLGVTGGLVTSLAIGARRTESAYRRFVDVSSPSDVVVLDSNDYGFTGRVDLDAVAGLPQVASVAQVTTLFLPAGRADGAPISFADLLPVISTDGRLGTDVDRQRIIEGRPADPERPDEAVIGFDVAAELGLGVGSQVEMLLVEEEQFAPLVLDFLEKVRPRMAGRDLSSALDSLESATGGRDRYRVEIVGIEAAPGEFPPQPGDSPGLLHLTPAFGARHGQGLIHQNALYVRLRPGASPSEFKVAAERVAGDLTIPFLYTRSDQQPAVQRSFELQSAVLWSLVALLGVSAAIVLAQVLVRQSIAASNDSLALAAVGFTRMQRTAMATGRAGIQASIAAFVLVVVGWAASGLWSFGVARVAEIDPGPSLDRGALLVGAVVLASFVVAVVMVSAWRAAGLQRVLAQTGRPSRVATVVGSLPVPASFRAGVQWALRPGRGPRAVPVRSAVLALGAAVAVMAAVVTMQASLDRLVDDPEAYGWNWDARIGMIGIPDISADAVAGLRANGRFSDVSNGTITQLAVNGARVDAYALDTAIGQVEPVVLEGRGPRQRDEIVLGSLTMRSLEAAVGDHVEVGIGARRERLRVVGSAVMPAIGDRGQLGRGAWITFGALRRLVERPVSNVLLVRVDADADRAATLASLHHALDPFPVIQPTIPEDLVVLGQADQVQRVAMLMLGGLGAATLLHAQLTARRRRAREIGTLQAIGFTRRQVVGIFVGQSVALAVIALVLGLVVGVIGGRLAWMLVGRQLGFPADPHVPVALLGVIGLGLIVGAALLAVGPGRAAGRRDVSVSLRTE